MRTLNITNVLLGIVYDIDRMRQENVSGQTIIDMTRKRLLHLESHCRQYQKTVNKEIVVPKDVADQLQEEYGVPVVTVVADEDA